MPIICKLHKSKLTLLSWEPIKGKNEHHPSGSTKQCKESNSSPSCQLWKKKQIPPNGNDYFFSFFFSSLKGAASYYFVCLRFIDCRKPFIFSGKLRKGHIFLFTQCLGNCEKSCMLDPSCSNCKGRYFVPPRICSISYYGDEGDLRSGGQNMEQLFAISLYRK